RDIPSIERKTRGGGGVLARGPDPLDRPQGPRNNAYSQKIFGSKISSENDECSPFVRSLPTVQKGRLMSCVLRVFSSANYHASSFNQGSSRRHRIRSPRDQTVALPGLQQERAGVGGSRSGLSGHLAWRAAALIPSP